MRKNALAVGAAAATVGIIVGVVTLTGVGFRPWLCGGSDRLRHGRFRQFHLAAGILLHSAMGAFLLAHSDCHFLHHYGRRHPHDCHLYHSGRRCRPRSGPIAGAKISSAIFFVFYYGVLADITPAGGARRLCRSGHCRLQPLYHGQTQPSGWGIAKAMVPFVFVYSPSLLLVAGRLQLGKLCHHPGKCHNGHWLHGHRLCGLSAGSIGQMATLVYGIGGPALHLAGHHHPADRSGIGHTHIAIATPHHEDAVNVPTRIRIPKRRGSAPPLLF